MNRWFFATSFLGIRCEKVARRLDARRVRVRHFNAVRDECRAVLRGMQFCEFC